jgi:hypothetical protein
MPKITIPSELECQRVQARIEELAAALKIRRKRRRGRADRACSGIRGLGSEALAAAKRMRLVTGCVDASNVWRESMGFSTPVWAMFTHGIVERISRSVLGMRLLGESLLHAEALLSIRDNTSEAIRAG